LKNTKTLHQCLQRSQRSCLSNITSSSTIPSTACGVMLPGTCAFALKCSRRFAPCHGLSFIQQSHCIIDWQLQEVNGFPWSLYCHPPPFNFTCSFPTPPAPFMTRYGLEWSRPYPLSSDNVREPINLMIWHGHRKPLGFITSMLP